MKFKVTRKDIQNRYNRIYSVGYCNMTYLLYYHNAIGYNSGVYGWNFDLYELDNLIGITTGYRNTIGRHLENVREFEEIAKRVINDRDIDYDCKKELVDMLLYELLEYNKQL